MPAHPAVLILAICLCSKAAVKLVILLLIDMFSLCLEHLYMERNVDELTN